MCPGREGSRKLLVNCEVNAEQPGPSNLSEHLASLLYQLSQRLEASICKAAQSSGGSGAQTQA